MSIREYGEKLINLGELMKDENTRLSELVTACDEIGMMFEFRVSPNEDTEEVSATVTTESADKEESDGYCVGDFFECRIQKSEGGKVTLHVLAETEIGGVCMIDLYGGARVRPAVFVEDLNCISEKEFGEMVWLPDSYTLVEGPVTSWHWKVVLEE